MASGPECSVCNEAVYGVDADVISWDAGMTEAGVFNQWKMRLFADRVGVHRNRPAIFGIMVGSGWEGTSFADADNWGLTALYMRPKVLDEWKEGFPDMEMLSAEDAVALAPFTQYFKCGDKVENGDPKCGEQKYNDAVCPDRQGRASWHPGW
jgi:hypothetical protein